MLPPPKTTISRAHPINTRKSTTTAAAATPPEETPPEDGADGGELLEAAEVGVHAQLLHPLLLHHVQIHVHVVEVAGEGACAAESMGEEQAGGHMLSGRGSGAHTLPAAQGDTGDAAWRRRWRGGWGRQKWGASPGAWDSGCCPAACPSQLTYALQLLLQSQGWDSTRSQPSRRPARRAAHLPACLPARTADAAAIAQLPRP